MNEQIQLMNSQLINKLTEEKVEKIIHELLSAVTPGTIFHWPVIFHKCDVISHLHKVTGQNNRPKFNRPIFLTGRLPWPLRFYFCCISF